MKLFMETEETPVATAPEEGEGEGEE